MADQLQGAPRVEDEPRFSQLSPETQKFLRDLRPEDVGLLAEAIRLVRSLLTVGRFVKWSILTVVGAFIGMAMLGDALVKLKSWIFK